MISDLVTGPEKQEYLGSSAALIQIYLMVANVEEWSKGPLHVLFGTPVELPYISCKNLSDFTSKILEDNALFLQVSWKILEDKVWSCKILQENVWSCKILQENI